MWFRVGDGVHGPHNGHVATGHGLVDDLFGNVAAFVAGVHNAKLRIPKIPGVQVVVVVKGVDALQGHQQGKGVVVVGFVSLYGGRGRGLEMGRSLFEFRSRYSCGLRGLG